MSHSRETNAGTRILISLLILLTLAACADTPDEDDPADPTLPEADPTATVGPTATSTVILDGADSLADSSAVPSPPFTATRPPLLLPVVTPASVREAMAFNPLNIDLTNQTYIAPPQSFFMDYTYVITSTEGFEIHLDMTLQFSTIPDAAAVSIDYGLQSQFEDSRQIFNVMQVGPDSYEYQDGVGCIFDRANDTLADIEGFYETFPRQYLVGGVVPELMEQDVLVNGTLTDHYRAVASDLRQGDVFVSHYLIDLFMDQTTGHAVKLIMYAVSSSAGLGGFSFLDNPFNYGSGEISIEIDVYGLNEPQDIVPPSICEGAMETLYPVPDEVSEVRGTLEFTSYFTSLTAEELAAFYRAVFSELGWEQAASADPTEEAFSLTFTDLNGRQHYVSIRELSENERAVIISGE